MTWTTFAALTAPTLPELDANLAILSTLTPIPCSVVGTNSLTLTSTAGAAAISAYANYMTFVGIAANTNNGAVTAAVTGITGTLNVYKDTLSGPVVLTGGEIVQNTLFILRYDAALNSNAGGFHLQTSAAQLQGQTVSLSSLLTSSASVSGLLSAASLAIGGGDALVRFNSTLVTLTFNANMVPGAQSQATVTALGSAALNDNVLLGAPSIGASLSFFGFVSASGSIVVRAINEATAATISLTTLTFRVTDMGYAT